MLLLAACGGGGGSVTPHPAGSTGTATAALPTATTSFTFTQSTAGTASTQKRPQYIGAGTQSVSITLTQVNGSTVTPIAVHANVALTGCPCTVAGPSVPAGSDVFTISTYDGQYTAGTQNGNLISTGTTAAITIAANGVNTIAITLNGMPASFTISNVPSATAGTPFSGPATLAIVAKDADGNTILGSYAEPVTLTDSDLSGATTLATAGSDSPPAHQLLSSGDTATLAYTGLAIAPASIGATAAGATPASAAFAPALQPITFSTESVSINQVQNTQSFTASEIGWTNSPYNKVLEAMTPICGTYATVAPVTGTTFTVMAAGSLTAGTCNVLVSDFSGGSSASLPVSYAVHGLISYLYTGGPQTFPVPPNITSLVITVAGAQGGNGNSGTGTAGLGGTEYGTIPVIPGETLGIYVGGEGVYNGPAGYNGGGAAGGACGSGGGSSDIREGGMELSNRIAVGGGGGGAATPGGGFMPYGGNGGLAATAGTGYLSNGGGGGAGLSSSGGAGGTNGDGGFNGTAGILWQGGAGAYDSSGGIGNGGGGGGGYYGGGGGGSSTYGGYGGGGGGGSSYIEASATGVVSNTGTWTGNGDVTIQW